MHAYVLLVRSAFNDKLFQLVHVSALSLDKFMLRDCQRTVSMTRNKMRVAIESGKGMKVKVVKLCWNKCNGPFLMHICDKQCGIMQKNQWKGPNFQIRCFTMGRQELCAENAQKTPKLEKLKRKLLNFLKRSDLYRVVPWERWRPENSENVVVFEI